MSLSALPGVCRIVLSGVGGPGWLHVLHYGFDELLNACIIQCCVWVPLLVFDVASRYVYP